MPIVRHDFASRQEWLDARQRGIGASEASTVLGVNPYQKEKELLIQKSASEVIEKPSNPAMREGAEKEPFILSLYENYKNTKLTVVKDCFYVNDKYPYLFASLDGEVRDKDGVLTRIVEAKLVRKDEIWEQVTKDSTIPAHFVAQLQQLLAVCEPTDREADIIFYNPKVDNFVILTHKFHTPSFTEYLVKAGKFWEQVQQSTPELLMPEVDESTADLLEQYRAAVAAAEEANTQVENIKAGLKFRLEQAGKTQLFYKGQPALTLNTFSRTSLDSKSLKADLPDVYAKYMKESSVTTFKVSV